MKEQRRLAAILVADVVGYSKLVGSYEAGTLARFQILRSDVIEPAIAKHAGRLFKAVGDGFLVEFVSAVQAVEAARAIQQANAEGLLPLRIGIHVGDVVVQGDDLMGDGINVAARIEAVADAGGIALSRQVYDQVRDRLDVAFLDKGEVELKNIVRPVHVFAVAAMGSATSAAAPALALPDKPSIAVLPFQNMSGDPEQEYFADGMVEDIITALSRFKSLFVIARNSSFAYKGKTVDVRRVGRELGVRYILEGSVRKAGGRLRITGQLVESATGAHLWADRFDGSLEDVFDLQDRITTTVVGAIAPKLDRAEIERARRKPAEDLDAYDCFLRGLAMMHVPTRESCDAAIQLLYRAIELDPDFSTPYGLIANCYSRRKSEGWTVDTAREEAETTRLASHVSRDGVDDALALCASGHALAYICRDYEVGVALIDRGLAINQNLAFGWQCRGWASLLLGQHEVALDQLARTLRLNPLDPQSFSAERGMAAAFLHLERYDEAVKWAAAALAHEPGDIRVLRTSASIYALAGRLDEAREIMAHIRRLRPEMRLSHLGDLVGLSRQQDINRLIEGLRLAGMPE